MAMILPAERLRCRSSDFQAVHVRQEHIDKGQIYFLMLQETQAVFSIFDDQDTVPRPSERHLKEHPYLIVVINEQDSRHWSSHPFPA
jgi:hypothetical protein